MEQARSQKWLNRNREYLILSLIFLIGGGLMTYGIWVVRPVIILPDEAGAIERALRMGMNRSPFTKGFRKGGNLHVHLLLLGFIPYYGYLVLTGKIHGVIDGAREVANTGLNPWEGPGPFVAALYDFVIIGRMISVIMGIATIWISYLIGKRIFNRRAGLLGAAFLAVSMIFINTAHFATEDTVVTFFVALTFFFLVVFNGSRNEGDLLRASFVSGLAVSSKATAGMLVLPMGLALFRFFRGKSDWPPAKRAIQVIKYPLVAGGGYVLTTPSIIVYPNIWWNDVVFELQNQSKSYASDQIGWLFQLGNIANGLGFPLFVLAMISVAYVMFTITRDGDIDDPEVYLLVFIIPFYLLVGSWDVTSIWRLIPLIPLIMVFTGGFLDGRLQRMNRKRIGAVVIGSIWLMSLWYTSVAMTDFTTDSRRSATDWAHEHMAAGSTVDVHSTRHYLPGFPESVSVERRPVYLSTNSSAKEAAFSRVRCGQPEFVAESSFHYGRYLRHPDADPESTRYYRELFRGKHPYSVLQTFGPTVKFNRSTVDLFRESIHPEAYKVNPRIVIFNQSSNGVRTC